MKPSLPNRHSMRRHRRHDGRLEVRDEVTGEAATLEVLDVLVEMEGGWKLLNVAE